MAIKETFTVKPQDDEFAPELVLTLVPFEEAEEDVVEKTITLVFGELSRQKDDEDPKIAGRYRASLVRVVDGVEETVSAMAASALKAVELLVKDYIPKVAPEDYDIQGVFDESDAPKEWFEQKIAAPTDEKDNPWKGDDAEELEALRVELDAKIGDTYAGQADTQEDYRDIAKTLKTVYNKLGNKKAKLEAWRDGASGSNTGENLKKFGKGNHALTEAMRLAEITDAEYAMLPVTTISGKAIDRHKSLGVKAIAEAGAIALVTTEGETIDGTWKNKEQQRMPTLAQAEKLVRLIADRSFKVVDAMSIDLVSLIGEVDAKATEIAAAFEIDHGGKNVRVYDTDAYKAAVRAYGAVTVSGGGSIVNKLSIVAGEAPVEVTMFAEAVHVIERSKAMPAEQEGTMKNDMLSLYKRNMLMKHAIAAAVSTQNSRLVEQRNKNVIQKLKETPDLLPQKSATAYEKLTPLEAAAGLLKTIGRHPQKERVWDMLKSLVAQNGFSMGEPEKGEADDAGDDEETVAAE